MRCPVCTMEMRLSERQGIEIDYCPQCRGIWLDRGELDKIIERTAGMITDEPDHRYSEVSKKKRGKSYQDSDHDRDYRHTYVGKKKYKGDRDRDDRDRGRRKKNRVSDFIEEVFDIF